MKYHLNSLQFKKTKKKQKKTLRWRYLDLRFWNVQRVGRDDGGWLLVYEPQDHISLMMEDIKLTATSCLPDGGLGRSGMGRGAEPPTTHHVPEDGVLQSGVAHHQVEGVGARHGVEFRLALGRVQLELVLTLAVRLGHEHHLLARFLVVQSHEGLTRETQERSCKHSKQPNEFRLFLTYSVVNKG